MPQRKQRRPVEPLHLWQIPQAPARLVLPLPPRQAALTWVAEVVRVEVPLEVVAEEEAVAEVEVVQEGEVVPLLGVQWPRRPRRSNQ